MIGSDFTFNGHNLSDFNCSMFDPSEDQQFVSREMACGEQSAVRPRPTYYGSKYSGTLELKFLICKDIEKYENITDKYFSQSEERAFRAWIEGTSTPSILSINPIDQNDDDIYYFGVFGSVQPWIANQRCAGFYLTFNCDSPYGYSQENTIEYVFSENAFVYIVGLSTDVKPTDTIDGVKIYNGSTLYEMDTQKMYVFDEENTQWVSI